MKTKLFYLVFLIGSFTANAQSLLTEYTFDNT